MKEGRCIVSVARLIVRQWGVDSVISVCFRLQRLAVRHAMIPNAWRTFVGLSVLLQETARLASFEELLEVVTLAQGFLSEIERSLASDSNQIHVGIQPILALHNKVVRRVGIPWKE